MNRCLFCLKLLLIDAPICYSILSLWLTLVLKLAMQRVDQKDMLMAATMAVPMEEKMAVPTAASLVKMKVHLLVQMRVDLKADLKVLMTMGLLLELY